MKLKRSLFILTSLAIGIMLPVLASAATGFDPKTVGTLINDVNDQIVAAIATLFIAAAMAAFFFGMAQFIFASRNADAKKITEGRQFMLWGVAALFITFSIYGIILFGQDIFFKGMDINNIKLPRIMLNGSAPRTANPLPTSPSSPTYVPDNGTPIYGQNSQTQDCTGKSSGSACANQTGTCKPGNASTDYQLYCQPNGSAAASECSNGERYCRSGQGACVNGQCVVDSRGAPTSSQTEYTCPDGKTKYDITLTNQTTACAGAASCDGTFSDGVCYANP